LPAEAEAAEEEDGEGEADDADVVAAAAAALLLPGGRGGDTMVPEEEGRTDCRYRAASGFEDEAGIRTRGVLIGSMQRREEAAWL